MRFEKKKMRFDGVTRHMGSNIRRYVYDTMVIREPSLIVIGLFVWMLSKQ